MSGEHAARIVARAKELALLDEINDLRSRLACVVEASYWDRPYDTRIEAIRGMCDLTTDGMTPTATPGAAFREAAAEALEEAADERGELWTGSPSVHFDCAERVGTWLHGRAADMRTPPGAPS